MDPYSVLGVRRNASKTEIDLAYKGRRSQYHPDRYANEDAETVGWATERMKEVNDAYALLSNPQGHVGKNAQQAQDDKVRAKQAPELKEHLLRHLGRSSCDAAICIAPDIPRKKLLNALSSYGSWLKPEDVVVLIDDTAFGGAKDGVIITKESMCIKEIFQDPAIFWLSNVDEVEADGNRIYVNGRKVAKLTIPDAKRISLLMDGVNDYLQAMRSSRFSGEDDEFSECEEDEGIDESSLFDPEDCVLWTMISGFHDFLGGMPDKKKKADLMVCLDMLTATGWIPSALNGMGVELTSEDENILTDDVVRFELLAYIFARGVQFFAEGVGQDKSAEFGSFFLEKFVMVFVVAKEELGDITEIHRAGRLERVMNSSCLYQEFQSRMAAYFGAPLDGRGAQLFVSGLRDPAVGLIYEETTANDIKSAMNDVVDRFFDINVTRDILRGVESLVSSAISRYRLNRDGSWR